MITTLGQVKIKLDIYVIKLEHANLTWLCGKALQALATVNKAEEQIRNPGCYTTNKQFSAVNSAMFNWYLLTYQQGAMSIHVFISKHLTSIPHLCSNIILSAAQSVSAVQTRPAFRWRSSAAGRSSHFSTLCLQQHVPSVCEINLQRQNYEHQKSKRSPVRDKFASTNTWLCTKTKN